MKNFLNPKWLYLINTLPIIALLIFWFVNLSIIYTDLSVESIQYWIIFSLALCILGLTTLVYAMFAQKNNKHVSALYGLVSLVSQIAFVYCFNVFSSDLIPFGIPRWMLSSNSLLLYTGTFLMPGLLYSFFIIVYQLTQSCTKNKFENNLFMTIISPLAIYLFSQVLLPFWQPLGYTFENHVTLILIICSIVIFLFFLARTLYIFTLTRKTKKRKGWLQFLKILFCFIFPIIGLGITMNFLEVSHPLSLVIAILNGFFLCINPKTEQQKFWTFVGRSICFPFSLYFFLVFLPYTPISIIAIIAFGIGLLMISPIVNFIIHIIELKKDFQALLKSYCKLKIYGIFLGSLLIIPSLITVTYLYDKHVLNTTLDYLYNPDYTKEYSINHNSLKRTMNLVKKNRRSSNDLFSMNGTPILSSYYKWIVLDNLTLSNEKIEKIEKVFFKKSTKFFSRNRNPNHGEVQIENIQTQSKFDTEKGTWISWVNLEITNCENQNLLEYATTFDLPEGCFISDYYLYVDDRKEMGILSAKKAATWLYNQITRTNRDPGILNYLSGNKIQFRVFPFGKYESRSTGIEFIHKEPVNITIDGKKITLGNSNELHEVNFENDQFAYISVKQKQGLPQVKRTPYFHFLVDVSKGNATNKTLFKDRINVLKGSFPKLFKNAKIDFVNSTSKTFLFDENWEKNYIEKKSENGFFVDRAIKKTLVSNYLENSKKYPVIVVVTDDFENAILDQNYADFKLTFPDSELFYELNNNGELVAHSLISNSEKSISSKITNIAQNNTVEFLNTNNQTIYLPDNGQSSLVLKQNSIKIDTNLVSQKNWKSAATLQASHISQTLLPQTGNKEWLSLVKNSFKSKIMTPATAYMVVETEAQKTILKKKQNQVLNGNKSLDTGEDTRRMSEPGFWLFIFFIGLSLIIKKLRTRKILIPKNKIDLWSF